MYDIFRIGSVLIKSLLALQTVMFLYPMLTWFGEAGEKAFRIVRRECEILTYPIRVLLRDYTDRHPSAIDLPLLVMTAVMYCATVSLPAV